MTVAAKGRRFAPGPVAGWNDKAKIVKRFGTSRSTFTPAYVHANEASDLTRTVGSPSCSPGSRSDS